MLEYASIRLMLLCAIASRLPTVMVSNASAQNTAVHTPGISPKATSNTRSRTAKPAAFDATDRYAVTVVGAPSYTSGVHIWNGTAEILKPKPATTIATAIMTAGVGAP